MSHLRLSGEFLDTHWQQLGGIQLPLHLPKLFPDSCVSLIFFWEAESRVTPVDAYSFVGNEKATESSVWACCPRSWCLGPWGCIMPGRNRAYSSREGPNSVLHKVYTRLIIGKARNGDSGIMAKEIGVGINFSQRMKPRNHPVNKPIHWDL